MIAAVVNLRQLRNKHWPHHTRLALLVTLGVALVLLLIYELGGYFMLGDARKLARDQQFKAATEAYAQVIARTPFATAAPRARHEMTQLMQVANVALPRLDDFAMRRWLGEQFSPLRVDWLPLWGFPLCGVVLSALTLARLGRRNRWAAVSLVLAAVAMAGTVLLWGRCGFTVGRWLHPALAWCEPALGRAIVTYSATWLLVSLTFALLMPRYARPQPVVNAKAKVRPTSPNDPRMALEYLNSQRADHGCSAAEYARRREAILSRL